MNVNAFTMFKRSDFQFELSDKKKKKKKSYLEKRNTLYGKHQPCQKHVRENKT